MLEVVAMVIAAAAVWLLIELGALVLFYWPGWVALRLITFGRYPPSPRQAHNRAFVSTAGAAVLLVCVMLTTVVMNV